MARKLFKSGAVDNAHPADVRADKPAEVEGVAYLKSFTLKAPLKVNAESKGGERLIRRKR